MLAIPNKKLGNTPGPKGTERGFAQQFFHFLSTVGIDGNPHLMSLHTHHVLINNFFIDQVVDISAMRGNQIHKIVPHLKLDRHLVLLHNY